MSRTDRGRERGQLLVVFALTLVGLIGAVGLVIDGGSTFVQRRDQQNVADAAAMAAGYADLMGSNPTATARSVASANGYTHGASGVDVAVTVGASEIVVTVTKPHANYFASLVGLSAWNVSATATVEFGVPNGVYGAMPLIFNIDAYNDPGNRTSNPGGTYGEPLSGSEDVPLGDAQFNWTVYCEAGVDCNADSATVDELVGIGGYDATIYLSDEIAPLNAGSHTTLFDDLSDHVGEAWPVGIVDNDGNLVGWSWFHLTGAVGGSTKEISGWFDDQINVAEFRIGEAGGVPVLITGAYVVKLIN